MYVVFVFIASVALYLFFFFFKQKTAYEMRISDWSSDVCSSDLAGARFPFAESLGGCVIELSVSPLGFAKPDRQRRRLRDPGDQRSERIPEIGRASCRERVCQYV